MEQNNTVDNTALHSINDLSVKIEICTQENINIGGLTSILPNLKMHYLVYEIFNIQNGKHYIGLHLTNNPLDNYMGSGRLIQRAYKKYPLSSFVKVILFDFDNFDDMNNKEYELVLLSNCWPNDLLSYNMCEGGHVNRQTEYQIKQANKKRKIKRENRTLEEIEIQSRNNSEALKKSWKENKQRRIKSSISHSGEKNSMFGDYEHTKGFRRINKKRKGKTYTEIYGKEKAEQFLLKLSKATLGRRKMSIIINGIEIRKLVKPEEFLKYLELGYIFCAKYKRK